MRQKDEERRRCPRNNLALGVQCIAITEESNNTPLEFHGDTTDVSLRGFSLSAKLNPAISIGQRFQVMIQLFQNESPVEAMGQMCWLKESDQARNEKLTQIGFELLGMHPRGYDHWIERIHWT